MENLIALESSVKLQADDVKTDESKNFDSFNLDARILAGLSKAGYKIPSPVQREAIPLCQTGKDAFVQGRVGKGKTLVFSILALTRVLEAEDPDDLQVLIVASTREGACQIYDTIMEIGGEIKDLKCKRFIGGLDIAVDKYNADSCNLAVGTPGRLYHLIDQEVLEVDTIRLFVIDDIDELLNKFMKPEVINLFHTLPVNAQTIVTSLTCTNDVVELANEFLKVSAVACICNEQFPPLLGMTHYHHMVPFDCLPVLAYRKKLADLKDILLKVKYSQCIIFCKALYKVELLMADLKVCELPISSLTKAMDQEDRLQALEHLRNNKCKVLITTDVGARCLDAKNVDLVVNFDVPYDSRTYLQRCGRAGRYGAKCSSITFLTESWKSVWAKLEKDIQFKSFALPEPIPEVLNHDLNPSEAPGLPCKQPSSESNVPEYSITTLIELNINVVSNQKKTNAGGSCLSLAANQTEEQDAIIGNGLDEESANNEASNTCLLPSGEEGADKKDFENTEACNTEHGIKNSIPLTPHNNSKNLTSDIGKERAEEIKALQYFNKIYAGNRELGCAGIGFSASETLPKSKLKIKFASKDVSPKEFHEVQLKKEQIHQSKYAKVSRGTKQKKTSDKSCGSKTIAESAPVQPCKNFYPRCPDNHSDEKTFCNMQSKCIDGYVNQPNTYVNHQRSSSSDRKILVNRNSCCCKPYYPSNLSPFPHYIYSNQCQLHGFMFYHP